MDFSLDDAEAAFLQDILTGAEAANGAGFGSGSTTDYPRSTLLPNSGHAAPNSATSGPREDLSPSAPPSAALLSVPGRPPRPRNGPQASLSPKASVGPPEADATSWQQRLPRQPLEHTYPDPHQQQQLQHRTLTTRTPATRSTLSPLQLVPTRQPSDPSCGGRGSGATVVSRPRPAGASPYTTPSAASPPRAQPPPPPSTAVAAASAALPATTSSTSGSSEASSNTSAGEQHRDRNSNTSSNGSRRFCSNAALVCTTGAQPADIADPANPSSGPAVLPSRRARGVLQRISTLEVQLQQMLLAEGEGAGSPPLLTGGAAPGAPDPTAPPLGQSDPRVLQQQRSQQGPYERTARPPRQPLVFAVAEQLCRDYNSSGVALMEAGLDEAARQQLDKALLLAGPGGPLEGRTDKQREMQIVAHNNLACYYRKLKQAGMALEHLQQAAGLETAAAADGADGADAAVCSGPTAATLLNMAACCSSLGQHGQALSYAAQAVPAAAVELQVPLVPLESALLQGLPQVKLWDVLPQLRRADPGATTQLAMSYYNRAVEQEHMHQWQPALESYRLAVDVASRFAGRGDGLTQTMHQSAEAFKVRLRNLERQGKLRGRGASAAFTLAAAASSTPPLVSSSSANSRHPHFQPRPLRCTSSASTTAPVSTTNPTAPRRRISGLPAINRPASTPLGRETSATSTAPAATGARAHSAGPAAPSAPPWIAPLASSAPEPAASPWAPQTQLLTRPGPDGGACHTTSPHPAGAGGGGGGGDCAAAQPVGRQAWFAASAAQPADAFGAESARAGPAPPAALLIPGAAGQRQAGSAEQPREIAAAAGGTTQLVVAAAGAKVPFDWQGREGGGGGQGGSLADAAAAAAAAAAELARICDGGEENGTTKDAGFRSAGGRQQGYGGRVVDIGSPSSSSAAVPLAPPSPAPSLPVAAGGGSGWSGDAYDRGSNMVSQSVAGTRGGTGMLVPKRDGVAV